MKTKSFNLLKAQMPIEVRTEIDERIKLAGAGLKGSMIGTALRQKVLRHLSVSRRKLS